MNLVVMKFGGTSVGSIEKIKNVALKVVKAKQEGKSVIVTVSAMGGETDRLIGLLKSISENYNLREYDTLVSTGEQVSTALLTQAIIELGFDAISLTGRQIGMLTDTSHAKARIKEINEDRLKNELSMGKICVVAGFQGVNPDTEDVTTLGRGGSDTTAVAVAAAVGANVCEIYTDVDGIYTADPRIVKNVKKLEKISYKEMLELASLGAKVLHSRSIELAMKHSVDIMVLSSLEDKPGTLVSKEEALVDKRMVSGVTCLKDQVKITLKKDCSTNFSSYAALLEILAEHNIDIDMVVEATNGDHNKKIHYISFAVSKAEYPMVSDILSNLKKNLGTSDIVTENNLAKVSLVGLGLRGKNEILSETLKLLSGNGIEINMCVKSELRVSVLISTEHSIDAANILHNRFLT